MWLQHVVTSAPTEEPVSIEEARAQCQIEEGVTDWDVDLTIYIKAAREHFEQVTGQKLVTQTVDLRCSCFGDLAALPVAPIASVTSVKYLDSAGAEQTLDAAVYETVRVGDLGLQPGIRLKVGQTWPTIRQVSDAIRVVAIAGYGAAAAAPASVKLPLLLMIGDWFAHREDSGPDRLTQIPRGVQALLENHRL